MKPWSDTFICEQRPTFSSHFPIVTDHGDTNRSCKLTAGTQKRKNKGGNIKSKLFVLRRNKDKKKKKAVK